MSNSTFLYKVVNRGISGYDNLQCMPITTKEFIELSNEKADCSFTRGIIMCDHELKIGERVRYIHRFTRSDRDLRRELLPIVVKGETAEELQKSIMENIESIADDLGYPWNGLEIADDRWSKFEKKLAEKLPEFLEAGDRLNIYSKVNVGWKNDEADWVGFKVRLYEAVYTGLSSD